MKYRIQFSASFNNTNSNAILNEIETVKTKVFNPSNYTSVPIIRKLNKTDYETDPDIIPNEYNSIDFDASEDTYSDTPTGITEFTVNIDISFDVEQDFFDCINYLESIKSNAIVANIKSCRHFECSHEESQPLPKDGPYVYMDFSGSQLTYPLV